MQTERWLMAAVFVVTGQQTRGQQAGAWATLRGHTLNITSLAFSPNGRTLASASDDGTVRLWEVATGKGRTTLKGHDGPVYIVAFSPSGRLLASGGDDGAVRMWDDAGRARGCLEYPGRNVLCLSFSPSGTALVVGGDGKGRGDELLPWGRRASGERLTLHRLAGCVVAVSFSADGRMLAVGDDRGVLTVRETASGKVRSRLRGHRGHLLSATFLPEGALLASGGEDGTVLLWDVGSGKKRATLKGHAGHVHWLSEVRQMLASAGEDGTVRLWDTAVKKQRLVLKLDSPVRSVAFSPGGKLLATGDAKGTIRLWSVAKLLAHKGRK